MRLSRAVASGNNPRVLVEFDEHEAAWLADRLHEEWARRITQAVIVGGYNAHVVQYHKNRAAKLMNRIVDKAWDQGFGHI